MILLLIIIIVAAFSFGIYYVLTAKRRQTRSRIKRIKARRTSKASPGDMSLRRKVEEEKGLTYWLAKPLPNFKALGDKLERAGKTISPKQYALRRLLAMIGIVVIVSGIFGKSIAIGFAVGLILGVWVPLKYLQYTIARNQKAFLRLFPDALDLIVRGLRSGLPVSESLILVSSEVPNPVGGLFSTISHTMKLGVTLEKALQEMARKLDLTEFNFFATCIVLQRETGGNLSEILNNLSEVLRNRYVMRMKIKAMSSEARASAYIIGALPFFVLIMVSIISPDYIRPLYTDYRGNIAAGIAACMMAFGGFVMNKMTKFEI